MPQMPQPESAIKLVPLAVLALGLAGLAFLAVLTVLLAARRSILPMQQIKSVAVTLLWIAPALALVGMVGAAGLYFTHTTVVREERSSGAEIRPARRVHRQAARRVVREGQHVNSATTTTKESAIQTNVVPAEAVVAQDSGEASAAEQRAASRSISSATDGVLHVVDTRTGAPDWAAKEPVPNDKGILVAISSQRFATLEEAAQQLTAEAVSYVKQFYHDEYPLAGDWTVPVSIIERTSIRNLVGESLDQDFGNGIRGTMYRAHLQLEMNSALRKGIHDSWHGQIVTHRLTVLGSMLGLMTLMLATSAGYFRLDDLTGGLYRGRLKFAAASLVAAGSLVAFVVT